MKFYQTKENNVINLEQMTTIYKNPATETYNISYVSGITYEMPELDEEDIDRIMEYNGHLIN